MTMNVAIIGTGPTAWASYLALTEFSPETRVTFIDAGERYNSDSSMTRVSGQKSKFGSNYMYSDLEGFSSTETPLNFSLANGGLSSTWGAGIRVWEKSHMEESGLHSNNIYSSAIALLEHLPYTGGNESLGIPCAYSLASRDFPLDSSEVLSNAQGIELKQLKIVRPSLAVETQGDAACRGCGGCLNGCPYGSIFDSGDYIDRLVAANAAIRLKGRVSRLQQQGQKVLVKLQNLGIDQSLTFDEVILCAGAIGTPLVLLQSGLIGKSTQILDSQVFYFSGIKFKWKSGRSRGFALSRNAIYCGGSSSSRFYASFYTSNVDVRKRISELLSGYMFGIKIPIPSFFDYFLLSGIGFLHSEASGIIDFEITSDKIPKLTISKSGKTKPAIKKALKTISKTLLKQGLFVPAKVFVLPSPGSGFHGGGGARLNSEYVDEKGRLRNSNRIRIGDTSLLSAIEPGPHTFMAMCLTHSLIMGT